MNIKIYPKNEWDEVSEDIHKAMFNETRPASLGRYDFVVSVWDEENPIGYVHCRETDAESIYIGHGAVFHEQRQNEKSKIGFDMILDHLKVSYWRANILVENDNIFMLKKALNHGFKVVGVTNYCNTILIDMRLEWSE